MKKMYLLFILFLIGCSNQIKCENNDSQITIVKNKNKIDNIKIQLVFKNDEEAKNYCTLLELTNLKVKCNKNIITYVDYKDYLNKEYFEVNELVEYLENNDYICK